jgi:hypothetical protein
VYLKVSPMKGVKRFGVKGKLASRYIGPFPILEKCVTMTYKLELPLSLAGVHDIFHVSQLKGTRGCGITGSSTTRVRFDIS